MVCVGLILLDIERASSIAADIVEAKRELSQTLTIEFRGWLARPIPLCHYNIRILCPKNLEEIPL